MSFLVLISLRKRQRQWERERDIITSRSITILVPNPRTQILHILLSSIFLILSTKRRKMSLIWNINSILFFIISLPPPIHCLLKKSMYSFSNTIPLPNLDRANNDQWTMDCKIADKNTHSHKHTDEQTVKIFTEENKPRYSNRFR